MILNILVFIFARKFTLSKFQGVKYYFQILAPKYANSKLPKQCVFVTTTWFKPTTSLAKWLSVRLRTKWSWVWITLLSLKLQIWRLPRAKSFLKFRQTIECGNTLKLVRDTIITYSQMRFWSQIQLFSILNKTLQFYKFEGANLKYDICFFQILSKKTFQMRQFWPQI